MSTRAVIARVNGDGFKDGRYHHWDGYPRGVGATLYKLYHGYFKLDLGRMLTVLLDEHPAGWSTINDKDFKYKPRWRGSMGYKYPYAKPADRHPVCYCHGDRNEDANEITEASNTWCEWAYVVNEHRHLVTIMQHIGFEHGDRENGRDLWQVVAQVDLDGPEPDWKEIEAYACLLSGDEAQCERSNQC